MNISIIYSYSNFPLSSQHIDSKVFNELNRTMHKVNEWKKEKNRNLNQGNKNIFWVKYIKLAFFPCLLIRPP